MAAIAAVHTGFNTVNTLLFLPFVKPLALLVSWMVPEKQEAVKIPHLTHLDIRFLDTPAISIVQSHKQILFMAECNETMIEKLAVILESGRPEGELEKSIFGAEETLDVVQKEVVLFLGELLSGQVPHDITEKVRGQMRMADEYESVSDYAASVLKGLRKPRTNNLQLTPDGLDEIKKLNSLIYSDRINYYRRINDHTLNIAEVAAGEKWTLPPARPPRDMPRIILQVSNVQEWRLITGAEPRPVYIQALGQAIVQHGGMQRAGIDPPAFHISSIVAGS